ncbi:MAG: glycosyltransferase family 2 protein [Chloroflexi bacterium]|nr:glycosyltransferase family 2 protein [Chloroflexota bacterium]
MSENPSLSVIIPAYNEADVVAEVVSGVRGVRPDAEIIVVDDASTDGTGRIAKELGVVVVRHPYNKGNGAAVKSGLRRARGEIVLLMDADGQHDAEDVEDLLAPLGDYDMVVGARTTESDTSIIRDLGNFLLNRMASYLVGIQIPDLTSGFRAMKREVIMEFIHLLPNAYSYPTTSTLSLLKAGYSVKFTPIKMHRRVGKSKVKLLRDGVRFVLIILKMITLYSPLKVFFPISAILFLLGSAYAVYTIATQVHITNSSVLLISMSIIIFLIGLVSEQVAALRFERYERDE